MELFYIIFGALLIDGIVGDPQTRFHPVVLIGNFALNLEIPLRKKISNEFAAGMICTLVVTFVSALTAYLLVKICSGINYSAGIIAAAICLFIAIALKSLLTHARAIEEPLKNGCLGKARRELAMIVSRDTAVLDENGIIRSSIESIGENIVDGITAAIFYATLGWYWDGPSGAAAFALFYRAANTLDATFGYKNTRYRKFGAFPARLDDVLNYIPARLTLLAIYLAAILCRLRSTNAVKCAWRDRGKHPSPNSAWSMAAFAGALGIQLGGPTCYKGIWKKYPYWGIKYEELKIEHIRKAGKLAVLTAVIFSILMLSVSCL